MIQKLRNNNMVFHSKIKDSPAMMKLRNMTVFIYDVSSMDKLEDLDFELSKILLDVSVGAYCYLSNLPIPSWKSAVVKKQRSAIKRRPSDNKRWEDPVYLLGVRPPRAPSSRLKKNSKGKKKAGDDDPSPSSHFSLELSDENKKTKTEAETKTKTKTKKEKIKRHKRSELEEKVSKLTEYQEALKVAVKKVGDRCEELKRKNIELKKVFEERESLLPTDHQEALGFSIISKEKPIDNRLEEPPEEDMATVASAHSPQQEEENEEESIKISQSQPSKDDRTAMDVDLLSVDQMGAARILASQRRPLLIDLNDAPLDDDEEEVVELLDCLMRNKAAACEEEGRRSEMTCLSFLLK